jgi:hypothetical protein
MANDESRAQGRDREQEQRDPQGDPQRERPAREGTNAPDPTQILLDPPAGESLPRGARQNTGGTSDV